VEPVAGEKPVRERRQDTCADNRDNESRPVHEISLSSISGVSKIDKWRAMLVRMHLFGRTRANSRRHPGESDNAAPERVLTVQRREAVGVGLNSAVDERAGDGVAEAAASLVFA
jgi:hypothetical protein